jgi:Caspase domain
MDGPGYVSVMRVRLFVLATIVLTSLCFCHTARCSDSTGCSASANEPVKVCFEAIPLSVLHCSREIEPHFEIARVPNAAGAKPSYYFTYQLWMNGTPVSVDPVSPIGGKYLLTEDGPPLGLKGLHIKFRGNGNYSIRVSVKAEGLEQITETSPVIVLNDSTKVRAVIVGISKYDNSDVSALYHADEDARLFKRFLLTLVPTAVTTLLVSDDQNNRPTQENILGNITREADEDHELCSDDWFIFYFSGHGVVDGDSGHHLLSTVTLNATDLSKSAIRIGRLLEEIGDIRAGNKLVILDSCFAGLSTSSDASAGDSGKGAHLKPARLPHHAKVEYVYQHKISGAFDLDTSSLPPVDGDLLAFKQIPERERLNLRRALYLSASSSDHEAQEGVEQFKSDGSLSFTSSENESPRPDPQGHGLFTYVLVWRGLMQLPIHSNPGAVFAGTNPVPTGGEDCSVNFGTAYASAAGDIATLAVTRSRDFQAPEISGKTDEKLPPLGCAIQSGTATNDHAN